MKMDETNKKGDKSSWIIGGTLFMGMGVGFIFLRYDPLIFIACIFIGLGIGLVITPLISKIKGNN
jgi:hypothetical protein